MGNRRTASSRVRDLLPHGVPLPHHSWAARHQQICRVLWAHVAVLPVLAVLLGSSLAQGLADALVPALLAVIAGRASLSRNVRAGAATLGLLTFSALLIHLTDGLIEAHFHFFVIVVLVALYQSWVTFLLALGFVVLHHGLLGTVVPTSVFNHAAALTAPWKWALLHGGFVFGLGATCLMTWRINEEALQGERRARMQMEGASREMTTAQELAGVGSWYWNLDTGETTWSLHLYRLLGLDPDTVPHWSTFEQVLHPRDRDRVVHVVNSARVRGQRFKYVCTVVTGDGAERLVECIGHGGENDEGHRFLQGTLQDITERTAIERRLEHDALHDPLTGLGNRTLFQDRVHHALEVHRRHGWSLAVLCLDIDEFKTVNDSLGHSVGDQLLVQTATRLQAAMRPADTLARLGGDEFGILLEDTSLQEATRIASALAAEMLEPVVLQGLPWSTRASIGIAAATDGGAAHDLLRNADLAMYAAKRSGHGGQRTFDPSMLTSARSRMSVRAELEAALETGQLRVHYQPIVRLDTGEVQGMEALVRWQHPGKGIISPLEFIPLAEETGMIVPLGAWVLQQATAAAGKLQRDLGVPLTLTVNVSAVQLQTDLPSTVRRALKECQMDPRNLVLELTESTVVSSDPMVLQHLSTLRGMGVRIAIDDFGTGYSSLARLRRLPIDILKIDRSFVDELTNGGVAATALVEAIVQLGRVFELQTVAEGVETTAQSELLLGNGCDMGQGFLYGRPLPLPELRSALPGGRETNAVGT